MVSAGRREYMNANEAAAAPKALRATTTLVAKPTRFRLALIAVIQSSAFTRIVPRTGILEIIIAVHLISSRLTTITRTKSGITA